jgi:hypothetical protein
MSDKDQRFQEYYNTGKYRGFQKLRDRNFKLFFSSTHLTFSNGQREIFARGHFKEEALKNVFDKIDDFHNN